MNHQVTFLNLAAFRQALDRLPPDSDVLIDAKETEYMDQDIVELLCDFRDSVAPTKRIRLSVVGLREGYALSNQMQFLSVLTREAQASLTSDDVLEILRDGNDRFVYDRRVDRDLLSQVILTSQRQFPMAVVLSCIDSRTTSELIFDLGLGDIFSIRVAGNVVNDDVLGSIEYATAVAGAKLIVVLGHTNCGAINAACDDVKLGHITGLLSKIKNVLPRETTTTHDRTSANLPFVENVTRLNVAQAIDTIRRESPVVRELIDSGAVGLVGGIYHLDTGRVEF